MLNNNDSSNNIIIKNDFMSSFIEDQLDNILIGIIIVVNSTKYKDIPSIPRYKSYVETLYCSNTNWNWLLLLLNNINIIKDIIRLNIVIDKPISLNQFFTLETMATPTNGITIKLHKYICYYVIYPYHCLLFPRYWYYHLLTSC